MTRALVVDKDSSDNTTTEVREVGDEFLGDGDLLIDVAFSSLNYKDGLALQGNPGIARTMPLIPGIDVTGTVAESSSERFREGDEIVLNGAGLGETRHGGYTGKLRIAADSTIALPEAFTLEQGAAIGTAGFTAALSVDALVQQGVKPEHGDILVTGATGGVGSVAIHLLKQLGYRPLALTGRVEEHGDYLRQLGAAEVLDRAEFEDPGKPMQKSRFAGVLDTVGSHTLVNAIAQTTWGGVVTACGMAQGNDLPGSVLPFILRAVRLIGINSVDAPVELRERAWKLLAEQLDTAVLEGFTETLTLETVAEAGADLLAGNRYGRAVVTPEK